MRRRNFQADDEIGAKVNQKAYLCAEQLALVHREQHGDVEHELQR